MQDQRFGVLNTKRLHKYGKRRVKSGAIRRVHINVTITTRQS